MDPAPTDEALLRSFLAGEHAALAELARRYEGPLLGLAAALLDGRTDMAADAIQETWLRVIRYGASFDARSSFKTWIYRIAINQCRTAKSAAARKSRDAAIKTTNAPAAFADPPIDGEDRERLREAVRALPPDRRMLILLCHHQGITNQTAAEILGLPLGTLKTRLRAAMTDLRARLNAEATP